MRFYIEQYGYFWSLSKSEFISALKAGIKHGYVNLETYKALKREPQNPTNIYKVLDWSVEDFKAELAYQENK